jgi:hypothetical protein
MIKEVWKDISGYEGLYQISNLGNIKSFQIYKAGKLLSPHKDKDGYLNIGIRDYNSHRKFYRIHRLVAEAFIPNPDNLPGINHKDCNTSNNQIDNLEWCTVEYNNQYRFTYGFASHSCERHPQTQLTNQDVKDIYIIILMNRFTEPQIANLFNTTRSVINKIKLKETWVILTD